MHPHLMGVTKGDNREKVVVRVRCVRGVHGP